MSSPAFDYMDVKAENIRFDSAVENAIAPLSLFQPQPCHRFVSTWFRGV